MLWIPPASPRCARPLDVLEFPEDGSGSLEPEESSPDVHEKVPAMPVIAVINRKGGSGKSTLATHLAGYYANAGAAVMLGDVDRQLSTQTWLRQRKETTARQRHGDHGLDHRPEELRPSTRGHRTCHRRYTRRVAWLRSGASGHVRGRDPDPGVQFHFDPGESAADCPAELRGLPRCCDGSLQSGHSRHATRRSHEGGGGPAGLGDEFECSVHRRAARSAGLRPLHRERAVSL